MIFIVFLRILRIQVRCRENRTCEDFNACYDPRTPSCLSMQLTVYKHFSFKPPPTSKMRFVFLIVSSTVYHSPYCYTVLNGFWTCPYIYMSALFCLFSSHKFLHLFTFAHPFFLLPFVPPFYFHYSFPLSHLSAHLFHRPQLYSSARFI